ncbi:MAG TPA: hypothetical protein VGE39_18820 [Prosthecobacter sp.]
MTEGDPVPKEWHDLFSAALNGTATDAEKSRLAEVLKNNASARQLWFLYNDNECGLAELKQPLTVAQTARTAWFSWRPLTAAAAGIVIGLSGATLVFGYAGSYAGKAISLLQESFESPPAPLAAGMPVEPGLWSGDFSEVVEAQRGVQPAQGSKMLRFLRADYEGKPARGGYVADLFRVVDLTSPELAVMRGDACISVEARFRALPQDGVRRGHCGVTVYALDALPESGEHHDLFLKRRDEMTADTDDESPGKGPLILATTARQEALMTFEGAWQMARSELRLPPGTRYVLIHLHQSLLQPKNLRTPDAVKFDGLYIDDVRVTLAHRPPLP